MLWKCAECLILQGFGKTRLAPVPQKTSNSRSPHVTRPTLASPKTTAAKPPSQTSAKPSASTGTNASAALARSAQPKSTQLKAARRIYERNRRADESPSGNPIVWALVCALLMIGAALGWQWHVYQIKKQIALDMLTCTDALKMQALMELKSIQQKAHACSTAIDRLQVLSDGSVQAQNQQWGLQVTLYPPKVPTGGWQCASRPVQYFPAVCQSEDP